MKGFSVGDTKGSQLLEAARVSTLLRQQTGWWVDQSTLVVKVPWSGRDSQAPRRPHPTAMMLTFPVAQIPKHEQIRDLWCRNYDTHLAQDSESNICDFVDQTTDKTEMVTCPPALVRTLAVVLEPDPFPHLSWPGDLQLHAAWNRQGESAARGREPQKLLPSHSVCH